MSGSNYCAIDPQGKGMQQSQSLRSTAMFVMEPIGKCWQACRPTTLSHVRCIWMPAGICRSPRPCASNTGRSSMLMRLAGTTWCASGSGEQLCAADTRRGCCWRRVVGQEMGSCEVAGVEARCCLFSRMWGWFLPYLPPMRGGGGAQALLLLVCVYLES